MAYPRRLDDEALAAARLEYETALISTRTLAAKFRLSKSSMGEWARKQRWVKFRAPEEIERRLEHDIRLEAQANEGAAFAKGLARSLRAMRRRPSGRRACPERNPGNRAEPPTRRDLADVQPVEQLPECQSSNLQEAQQVSCDRPRGPILANMIVPSGMVWSKPDKPKRSRKSAEIVPIRAGQHTALPKPGTMLLPARSKAERAKIRIDLGALRGVLLAEQIAVLGRHQELLADYAHLLALCLAPRDHLSLEGLSEMAHAEKIAAVQKEALSQVLPTERDTLAGAIKTLTSSLATTVQLKLRVADLAHSCIRNDEDEDRAGGRTRINELDTPTLRKVHEAMRALTGQGAKAAGTPSPPPPEPIDDIQ